MLVDWKAEQDEMKEILGDEYMDYNLVMASTFGLPLGDGAIRGPLKKLIEDYNLHRLLGNYYDSKATYEKLFDWTDEHKFKTGKYSYKEAVIDELATASPSEYLTKISIQVV